MIHSNWSARLAQRQLRSFTTSSLVCKGKYSHYDSLGITPKATQADVKAAYYELSKVYHPDRNKGSEAASKKFRDITEAYEILGNVKSRRLYDKGMSIGTTFGSSSQPKDRMSRFYEDREKRTRPSPSGGRQPIYDFDEWSKMHYGATFARDMAAKERRRMMAQRNKELEHSDRMERVVVIVALFVVLCMYAFREEDYDTVYVAGDTPIRTPGKTDNDKKD